VVRGHHSREIEATSAYPDPSCSDLPKIRHQALAHLLLVFFVRSQQPGMHRWGSLSMPSTGMVIASTTSPTRSRARAGHADDHDHFPGTGDVEYERRDRSTSLSDSQPPRRSTSIGHGMGWSWGCRDRWRHGRTKQKR